MRAWLPGTAPDGPVATPISVYFVPHQDDEVISMGAFIAADSTAGRDVRLVFLGDGRSSMGRKHLCDKQGICLTPQGQREARHREAVASAAALGVPAEKVSFKNLPEVDFTAAAVGAVLDEVMVVHAERATYNATSWLDRHPDHRVLGEELDRRCGTRQTCRFHMSPHYLDATPVTEAPTPRMPVGGWLVDRTGLVARAASAYLHQDLDAGLYAIGGKYSVPSSLQFMQAEHRNFAHLGSGYFRWRSDVSQSQRWSRGPMRKVVPRDLAEQLLTVDEAGTMHIVDPLGTSTDDSHLFTTKEARSVRLDGRLEGARALTSVDVDGDGQRDLIALAGGNTIVAWDLQDGHRLELPKLPQLERGSKAAVAPSSQGAQLLVWQPTSCRLHVASLMGPDRGATTTLQQRCLPPDLASVVLLPGGRDSVRTLVGITHGGAVTVHPVGLDQRVGEGRLLAGSLPTGSVLSAAGQFDGFTGQDILVSTPHGAVLLGNMSAAQPSVAPLPVELRGGLRLLAE